MLAFGFAALPCVLALAATAAVRRAGGPAIRVGLALGLWMAVTGGLASSGRLGDFGVFPPLLLRLVLVANLAGLAVAGLGRWRWSLAGLVLFQGFRLPLELLMHRAAEVGLMPPQMSYSGLNYDILTGASALVVGLLVWNQRLGKRAVWLWNIVGLALLVNVVQVAVRSFPGPLQSLWPDNTWVTHLPYVWLPTVLVPLAFTGHMLVFRELLRKQAVEPK